MSFKKDLKGTSLPEKTLLFYIQKYFDGVQYNIRLEELNYLELDIFIPSFKVISLSSNLILPSPATSPNGSADP